MPELTRRRFIAAAGAGAAGLALLGKMPRMAAAQEAPAKPPRKPNIIHIVADDLGYGELGCQGSKDIPTPNIDSIAQNGVRFTDGYVSCPVCSPTRAGLLTGRYQQRFGHEFNPGPVQAAASSFGLPLTEKTIANRLKEQGYATGMVGKWHLGYEPAYIPTKRGFDEFFGFLGGAHQYLNPSAGKKGGIFRGDKEIEEKEYLTDAFSREAAAFIDRHKAEPFFLYLPFNAVHSPLQGTDARLERFKEIGNRKRRTFAAMLTAMDEAVGQVLCRLREAGIEDQTLIFFHSDNGGPTPSTTSFNGPLRGYKAQVLEGGIRVPFFYQWKGRVPVGMVYSKPVISLDLFPTAVAAAGGAAAPELDGVNLIPHLCGENPKPPHQFLFWRFGEQSAVRMADWKMVQYGDDDPSLFNLAEDIGEKEDLAEEKEEIVDEMMAAYEVWDASNIQALWTRKGGRARRK